MKLLARLSPLTCLIAAAACGGAGDARALYDPWIDGPGPRQPAFLAFSADYDGQGAAPVDAPNFPKLLSQTGAFADTVELTTASGILPYDIQSPLWSDGAIKRRWISVPDGTALGYSETGHYRVPPGTVLVKHFEMALDERFPDERRRLETRFWVAVSDDAQYGVSYKWNEDQTDAELLTQGETEMLSIVGADGEARTQPYFFPGPADCQRCHNASAGFVLGTRTAQLNRSYAYRLDRPPLNQLVAWSSFGLLDAQLGAREVELAPQLVAVSDETQSLEDRVRSYWDGNCSMCHAGEDGVVSGWDARYTTAFESQGLAAAPASSRAGASQLITPGAPEDSFILLRGDTTDPTLRMPPLGRNRVDDVYIDVLTQWIASLETSP